MVQAGLSCRRKGGAHLGTTTGNRFLPRPARNERGEGWGEGHPVEWASSPQPSPPVGEERELISSGCLVVVTRCAPEREQWRRPRDHRRAHLGTTTKSARKRSAAVCGAPFEHYDYLVFMFTKTKTTLRRANCWSATIAQGRQAQFRSSSKARSPDLSKQHHRRTQTCRYENTTHRRNRNPGMAFPPLF